MKTTGELFYHNSTTQHMDRIATSVLHLAEVCYTQGSITNIQHV